MGRKVAVITVHESAYVQALAEPAVHSHSGLGYLAKQCIAASINSLHDLLLCAHVQPIEIYIDQAGTAGYSASYLFEDVLVVKKSWQANNQLLAQPWQVLNT